MKNDLELAAAKARRAIHDNDVEHLRRLLAEHPALLSWRGDIAIAEGSESGLLGIATSAFGDSFDPDRERVFTRTACAEALIDAGSVVTPSILDGLIESRTRGLLGVFQRKGLLPRTLRFLAAVGDLDEVRASLEEGIPDQKAVNDAFLCACRFEHEAVASVLLRRAMELDPQLGRRVDGVGGSAAFIRSLIDNRSQYAEPAGGPWQLFVTQQLMRAIDGDVAAFIGHVRRESWVLGEASIRFQENLIRRATLHDRGECLSAFLDLDPAVLRRTPASPSSLFVFAFTYAKPHLIPILTRVCPLPDDLPHAAGMGDRSKVTRWFDESGAPALGDLQNHFPCHDPRALGMLQWGAPRVQQVLDTALAWSVINRHFDVADFLLEHGADINTTWGSHEPASILHELVGQVATGENPDGNYESMRYLIERGIDMTIRDYRWDSTARGWALHAANDEKMAQWLGVAERQRRLGAP